MDAKRLNRFDLLFFFFITAFLICVAWFVSQLGTKGTFDSIHGVHVFGFDDVYRFFLSSDPFRSVDLWFWSFYLPGNIVADGFLSWMSGHDEFLMRSAHILSYMTGILFVYKAGLSLDIPRQWLFLSFLTLLLMPLNVLLSMSFYGESLLSPLLAMVIYCIVSQRQKALVFFSSMMPFFRPEGAFYLAGVFIDGLVKRKYSFSLFLAFPSLCYAIAVLFFFDWDMSRYYDWRVVFLKINDLVPFKKDNFLNSIEPFYLLNVLWWVSGFAGFFVHKIKPLRFLLLAAFSVLTFYIVAGALFGRNETRYLFPMFPLLALSQAALVSSLVERIKVVNGKRVSFIFVIFMAFIFLENILQIDPIRGRWFDGRRWPVSFKTHGIDSFETLNTNLLNLSIKQVASFTYAYTRKDLSINRVIISPFLIFDKLDGSAYRDGIRVEAATVKSSLVHEFVDDYFFTLVPEYPQYGLYRFYLPGKTAETEPDGSALFVDYVFDSPFADPKAMPIFENQLYRIYKVEYKAYKVVL